MSDMTVRSDAHDLVTAFGAGRIVDTRTERFDSRGADFGANHLDVPRNPLDHNVVSKDS